MSILRYQKSAPLDSGRAAKEVGGVSDGVLKDALNILEDVLKAYISRLRHQKLGANSRPDSLNYEKARGLLEGPDQIPIGPFKKISARPFQSLFIILGTSVLCRILLSKTANSALFDEVSVFSSYAGGCYTVSQI